MLLLKGRPHTSVSGFSHTHVVLWSNQAQHFGDGTRLSVLGKAQDRDGTASVPWSWTRCLSSQPWRKGVESTVILWGSHGAYLWCCLVDAQSSVYDLPPNSLLRSPSLLTCVELPLLSLFPFPLFPHSMLRPSS